MNVHQSSAVPFYQASKSSSPEDHHGGDLDRRRRAGEQSELEEDDGGADAGAGAVEPRSFQAGRVGQGPPLRGQRGGLLHHHEDELSVTCLGDVGFLAPSDQKQTGLFVWSGRLKWAVSPQIDWACFSLPLAHRER